MANSLYARNECFTWCNTDSKSQDQIDVTKVYAVSDLHVSYRQNRDIVEAIRPHPEDWLIIAGDVGETPDQLEWTLQTLVGRFHKLVWVPGNHELWTLPDDRVQLRGESRYRYLVEICRSIGVLTPEDPYPVVVCNDTKYLLVPLFLLYDYSFHPTNMNQQEALAEAWRSDIICADEFYLHSDPYSDQAEWCRVRVEWTAKKLEQVSSQHQLVLISHFPLRHDLAQLPHIPIFSLWCGTKHTEDWHKRYPVAVVVSGHLHLRGVKWRDGVRFEEVSLGYPYQQSNARPYQVLRQVIPE